MNDHGSVPEGLTPLYPFIPQPMHRISLYEGPLHIEQGRSRFDTSGHILFEWQNGIRVDFDAPTDQHLETETFRMSVPDLLTDAEGHLTRVTLRTEESSSYQLAVGSLKPTAVGPGGSVAHVDFQVANFPPYFGSPVRRNGGWARDRVELTSDPWRIVLDVIAERPRIMTDLRLFGGYAVLLAGRLNRVDGANFSTDDAEYIIDGLRLLLSFAAGDWAPVLLPVGFDASGDRVWERWSHPISRPWQGRARWFSTHHPRALAELFPAFMGRWRDSEEATILRHLINFYVEANGHVLLESRLVLAQAGLELLSWAADPKDQGRASDRIRKLLDDAGIPTALPTNLADLAQFAGIRDGPWVITNMRNGLVHPPRREELFDAPERARIEAWQLAMWYLELGLLRRLDFHGCYLNRLTATADWDAEHPPWVGAGIQAC